MGAFGRAGDLALTFIAIGSRTESACNGGVGGSRVRRSELICGRKLEVPFKFCRLELDRVVEEVLGRVSSWNEIKSGGARASGRTNALPPNACSSPSVKLVKSGLEVLLPPRPSRWLISTVVVLPFLPAKVCPSFCPEPFDIESHARPAAFDDAGGAPKRPPEALGDFECFLPSLGPRRVVNMTWLFFSGLGVLDVFVAGTGSAGDAYGVVELEV